MLIVTSTLLLLATNGLASQDSTPRSSLIGFELNEKGEVFQVRTIKNHPDRVEAIAVAFQLRSTIPSSNEFKLQIISDGFPIELRTFAAENPIVISARGQKLPWRILVREVGKKPSVDSFRGLDSSTVPKRNCTTKRENDYPPNQNPTLRFPLGPMSRIQTSCSQKLSSRPFPIIPQAHLTRAKKEM